MLFSLAQKLVYAYAAHASSPLMQYISSSVLRGCESCGKRGSVAYRYLVDKVRGSGSVMASLNCLLPLVGINIVGRYCVQFPDKYDLRFKIRRLHRRRINRSKVYLAGCFDSRCATRL